MWKTLSAPRLVHDGATSVISSLDDVKVILTESTRNPTIQGIRNHAQFYLLLADGMAYEIQVKSLTETQGH
ncbi:hypothetical protein [Bacteroides acidifaciens]|uniref:hypothetical protein n=1 Tax=Bacteroides acidifaciens TaxID=85831 RepID=UPI003F692D6C